MDAQYPHNKVDVCPHCGAADVEPCIAFLMGRECKKPLDKATLPAEKIDPDANIKNPKHYSRYVIEPLEFIEQNGIPYSEGNVIKYVCRWRYKDGIRDLKKAREYIDKIIERAQEQKEAMGDFS